MKRVFFSCIFCLISLASIGQRAISIYPLEGKLGYRSNLNKRAFWDLKAGAFIGGATVFAPDVEWSRIWRKRSMLESNVRMYAGVGASWNFIVPGVIVPIGLELILKPISPNLTLIAEANPRFDLFGTGAFQIGFKGHFGLAYHFAK